MPKGQKHKPVKIPADLHHKLRLQSVLEFTTIQDITTRAVVEYLSKNSKTRLVDPGVEYVTNAQEAERE